MECYLQFIICYSLQTVPQASLFKTSKKQLITNRPVQEPIDFFYFFTFSFFFLPLQKIFGELTIHAQNVKAIQGRGKRNAIIFFLKAYCPIKYHNKIMAHIARLESCEHFQQFSWTISGQGTSLQFRYSRSKELTQKSRKTIVNSVFYHNTLKQHKPLITHSGSSVGDT